MTVTDAEGLTDTGSIVITVVKPSDSDEISVTLLVNPAKDVAQVRIMDNGPGLTKVAKIYIHDSIGRLVATYNPKDVVANGLYEIPISILSSGEIYYIGFKMDNGELISMDLIVNNQ